VQPTQSKATQCNIVLRQEANAEQSTARRWMGGLTMHRPPGVETSILMSLRPLPQSEDRALSACERIEGGRSRWESERAWRKSGAAHLSAAGSRTAYWARLSRNYGDSSHTGPGR
jgi:hypothetical protein